MTGLMTQAAALIVLEHYLNHLAVTKDVTRDTISKIKQQIASFYDWLGERDPSPDLAATFILVELKMNRGYKRATQHSYYAALRPFLHYLDMPFDLKLKKVKRLPQYHTREEFQRILQTIAGRNDNWAKNKQRDLLIIRTLAFTGLRRGELLSLKCQDIKENLLFVYHGKGERDRAVPLVRKLREELAEYIREKNLAPCDRLFPLSPNRLYRIVADSAKRAGLDGFSPHQFRHYFATHLGRRGARAKNLQLLLGHEEISSTLVYWDLAPTDLENTVQLLDEENEETE